MLLPTDFNELHVGHIRQRLCKFGAQRKGYAGANANKIQRSPELLRRQSHRRQSHQWSLLASVLDRNSDNYIHAARQERASDWTEILRRGLSIIFRVLSFKFAKFFEISFFFVCVPYYYILLYNILFKNMIIYYLWECVIRRAIVLIIYMCNLLYTCTYKLFKRNCSSVVCRYC